MTKNDTALHPGEYFIERRNSDAGKWEFVYRDNDGDVMRTRYDYIVAELKPGQGVRFFSPACEIIGEVILDKADKVSEVTA